MTKAQKLIEKFKQSPQNVRYLDIVVILDLVAASLTKGKGSHKNVFYQNQLLETLPIHNGDCKTIYKQKLCKKLISLNLI